MKIILMTRRAPQLASQSPKIGYTYTPACTYPQFAARVACLCCRHHPPPEAIYLREGSPVDAPQNIVSNIFEQQYVCRISFHKSPPSASSLVHASPSQRSVDSFESNPQLERCNICAAISVCMSSKSGMSVQRCMCSKLRCASGHCLHQ